MREQLVPRETKESLTDDLRGCEFVVRGGASVEGGWMDREREGFSGGRVADRERGEGRKV